MATRITNQGLYTTDSSNTHTLGGNATVSSPGSSLAINTGNGHIHTLPNGGWIHVPAGVQILGTTIDLSTNNVAITLSNGTNHLIPPGGGGGGSVYSQRPSPRISGDSVGVITLGSNRFIEVGMDWNGRPFLTFHVGDKSEATILDSEQIGYLVNFLLDADCRWRDRS